MNACWTKTRWSSFPQGNPLTKDSILSNEAVRSLHSLLPLPAPLQLLSHPKDSTNVFVCAQKDWVRNGLTIPFLIPDSPIFNASQKCSFSNIFPLFCLFLCFQKAQEGSVLYAFVCVMLLEKSVCWEALSLWFVMTIIQAPQTVACGVCFPGIRAPCCTWIYFVWAKIPSHSHPHSWKWGKASRGLE